MVAGGDGTVNFAVNRMRERNLTLELGIIPAGTANDFAGIIGMDRDPLEAARQIVGGEIEHLDCGVVNGLHFVNIFSFGIFTTTSQHTPDKQKHRFGKLAYLAEGTKELYRMHAIPLHVRTEREEFDTEVLMCLVFNGETAGRVPLASKSSLRDGVFDCLFLRRRNLVLSIFDMVLYILGITTPAIRFLRTSTLTLATCLDEDTDVDGQRGGEFPMRVVCLRGELNVVCPQDHDEN